MKLFQVLLSLSVAALLVCPSLSHAQTITRGPYLQRGYKTFSIVKWTTSASTESVVKVGTTPGAEAFSFSDASGTDHRVELSGLQPSTKYYYKIVAGGVTLAGGDTSHYFVTSPDDGDEPFNVWAIGDSGISATLGSGEHPYQAAVRDAFLNVVPLQDLSFFVHLGDIAYYEGTDTQYQRGFFEIYPTILRALTTWPTQGNHDYTGNAYFSIFSLPRYGESGGVTSTTEAYYSWDHANAHFISLNSEQADSTTRNAMITWLNQDLAATTKTWTIVIFHHPPYTKGSHDSDNDGDSGGRMGWMRSNILPILEARGVDLVLSGHSHGYERSFLLNGHYGNSGTFSNSYKISATSGKDDLGEAYTKSTLSPVPNGGVVYVVAGSGGQLNTGTPFNHPAMYTSEAVLGSLHLEFNANELKVRFITSTEAVDDYFTIRKEGSRPRTPATLDVGAATSSCALPVTWSAATSATSYSIYRSNDTLTRGTLLANGITATTYSDPAPTPGVTHYYSVRGRNAQGDGPWSPQDSGLVVASDQDGDGTLDCNDQCPLDPKASTTVPLCGCGKTPLGTFADGSMNCSHPLAAGTEPTPPKLTTSKGRLRVTMDTYPGRDIQFYRGMISAKGRLVKSFSSTSSRVSTPLTSGASVKVRYFISFKDGTRTKSTRWSDTASVRIP